MLKLCINITINISWMLLIAAVALAHGEDKPGPHGGHIRMPANFHTEVVADQDGSFNIYLLDMQNDNAVIKNSEIKAYVQSAKKKLNLKCAVAGTDHFRCKGQKIKKSGSLTWHLVVIAKRDGVKALMEAKYELPLKPYDESASQSTTDAIDHTAHH